MPAPTPTPEHKIPRDCPSCNLNVAADYKRHCDNPACTWVTHLPCDADIDTVTGRYAHNPT